MFCPFCGSSVPDNVKFCPSCGGDVAAEMEADVTSKPSEPAPVTTPPAAAPPVTAPPAATPPVTAPPAAAPPVTTPPAASATPPAAGQNAGLSSAQKRELALAQAAQEGLGMGWYKFMIYFWLFAGAAVSFFLGGIGLWSAQIMGEIDQYSSSYADQSPLTPILVVTGILFIAFGVLNIFCRVLMARFSKKAIVTAHVASGISIACSLFGSFGSSLNENASSTMVWVFILIVSIVVLVINITYFKKRAHLFVND